MNIEELYEKTLGEISYLLLRYTVEIEEDKEKEKEGKAFIFKTLRQKSLISAIKELCENCTKLADNINKVNSEINNYYRTLSQEKS